MEKVWKCSGLAGGFLIVLAVLTIAGSAFAADAIRVEPTRQDLGTLEEGVSATMHAIVENIGSQDVHIKNVRTN